MSVGAEGVTDLVLSCTLVEEGMGMGGMGGSLFKRTSATLVLRDIAVSPDESEEMITSFVPPSIPDPDAILLEAKVSSPEIPNTDVLLHADCNEQEVTCEISLYSPHGSQESSDATYFMVSLRVAGAEFSTAFILRTLAMQTDQSTLKQTKLGLPLSPSGTLMTEVIFLVFSHVESVSASLKGDVLLNCGFKQQGVPLSQEVGVEWRLQHRGKGRKVFEMKTRLDDPEGSTVEHAERTGSIVDTASVVHEGNASVTLTQLKVTDEGTYICTVSVGVFHAQQITRLHVFQPPHVFLSEERLYSQTNSPTKLSCHCAKYYPLDAEIEWLSFSPSDTEPSLFQDQGSLTSHRQHSDGTYSLSSNLFVPSDVSPGTKIICRVSHPALEAPVSVSVEVESPPTDSYWWFLGFLIVTVLFFYQCIR